MPGGQENEDLMRIIAQKYYDDGVEKGTEKVITNMLKQKVDVTFIAKVAGLPVDKITKLRTEMQVVN